MNAESCLDESESHRNSDLNYRAKPSHQYARLPPELIDTIIGMLRSEQATLATCALVCRSWLPASRHHLFSHVTISPKKHSEIARLSAATCEITLAVKHLTLEEMEYLGDLCKVICRLPNVTQLSIHDSIVTNKDFSQPAWVSLLQDSESLEFTNVEFDTPGTLLSLLFSSPQLRSLHCDYVTFMIAEDPDSEALQDVFMPELKLVYVNETTTSLCWIISRLAIAAPQVTTLVLDLDPYSEFDVSWEPLLKAVGSRLQDLQLSHVPEDIPHLAQSFAFLSQLRSLSLSLIDHFPEPVEFIVQALHHLTSPHLRELNVILVPLERDLPDDGTWSKLDLLLESPRFTPTLRALTFRVRRYSFAAPEGWMTVAARDRWITERLPLCAARGIMRVLSSHPGDE